MSYIPLKTNWYKSLIKKMSYVDEDNLLFNTEEYKWQFYETGQRTVLDDTECPHKSL